MCHSAPDIQLRKSEQLNSVKLRQWNYSRQRYDTQAPRQNLFYANINKINGFLFSSSLGICRAALCGFLRSFLLRTQKFPPAGDSRPRYEDAMTRGKLSLHIIGGPRFSSTSKRREQWFVGAGKFVFDSGNQIRWKNAPRERRKLNNRFFGLCGNSWWSILILFPDLINAYKFADVILM